MEQAEAAKFGGNLSMADFTERLYEFLNNEEDARVCTDISDKACREVPGNFFLIVWSQLLTKLGDSLASSKIILPSLLISIGAPTFWVGLLAPIRESGSLIPQLLIGGYVRSFAIRKWFFVFGCLVQGLCVALMALVGFLFQGNISALGIVSLLIVFSLARGVCSVASKDVLGKTIPKTRRGRLSGLSASTVGAVVIGIGCLMLYAQDSKLPVLNLLAQ